MSALFNTLNLVQTTKTCLAQYDDEQTSGWLDNFMRSHSELTSGANFEVSDLSIIAGIIVYSLKAKDNWGSGYYWY